MAGAVLLATPVLILGVLMFAGGQVRQCLALYACGTEVAPILRPIVGSTNGVGVISILLCSTWLVVASATSRYLWSTDRARMQRVILVAAAVGIATAFAIGGSRFLDGERLRVVAEDAGLYALGALIVVMPLALAWAVLTARPASTST